MSSVEEMVKDCSIMKSYGSEFFTTMTIIPTIHSIKVEMVSIGSNGKDGITYYMPIEKMRQLAEEIDSHIFDKKILAETSSYPTAYQYVGGKDGCKKFNIGKSRKAGYVALQVQEKKNKKWNNRLMAVSMEDIKQMAFLFKLCLGLINVDADSYYGRLKAEYEKAVVEKSKFHKKVDKADLQEPEPTPEPEPEQKPAPASKQVSFEVTTCGICTEKGDFYILPTVNAKGDKYDLYVRKSQTDRLIDFNDVREGAADGVKLAGKGELKGSAILLSEGKIA